MNNEAENYLDSQFAVSDLAALLSLYGSSTRLRIFVLLHDNGTMQPTELAAIMGLSISAVSQHLSKLKAHRLISGRRRANTLHYSLCDHPIHDALARLSPNAQNSD